MTEVTNKFTTGSVSHHLDIGMSKQLSMEQKQWIFNQIRSFVQNFHKGKPIGKSYSDRLVC